MKRSPLQRKTRLQSHTEFKRSWMKPWRPKKSDGYTKELRDYIKERDGWCRVCGRPGHEVHHVIPRGRFKVHPEWYTFANVHDERNLMYICLSCHHKATDNNDELEAVIWIQEKRFGPLRKLVDWQ